MSFARGALLLSLLLAVVLASQQGRCRFWISHWRFEYEQLAACKKCSVDLNLLYEFPNTYKKECFQQQLLASGMRWEAKSSREVLVKLVINKTVARGVLQKTRLSTQAKKLGGRLMYCSCQHPR